MVSVFGRVVYAARRGKAITAGTSRFLIITGQGLSQVPVSYKPVRYKDVSHQQIRLYSIMNFKNCIFEVTLYAKLSVTHLTLALSTPIPKLIVATMTGTFPSIQSVWESVRSPAFRPAHTDINEHNKNSIFCIFNRNLRIKAKHFIPNFSISYIWKMC